MARPFAHRPALLSESLEFLDPQPDAVIVDGTVGGGGHAAAILERTGPNGLLIAECPNPHTLRIGAALYWQDLTHQWPLLPETLELLLRAAGFKLESRELLHPFPPDQLLSDDEGGTAAVTDPEISMLAERVDRLRDRLDEILNGPRDFVVRARK